jgi:hypothetical protein
MWGIRACSRMWGRARKKRQIVNGWSLGELTLNEKNKTQARTWIAVTNIKNKEKEVGVQRT